ncbi:mobilization protein [Clostridia bacterium]|nr:mobilization protein [Clostridia bacterium]
MAKQNLTRSKSISFRVTQEEYDMIRRRMGQTDIDNMRAYLLKQAIDGRVIHVNLECLAEQSRLLGNISNNINQVAKKANTTGNVYAADLADIKAGQEKIWAKQDKILAYLAEIEKGL